MTSDSVEPRTRNMSKDVFCYLEEGYPANTEDNYWIVLLTRYSKNCN